MRLARLTRHIPATGPYQLPSEMDRRVKCNSSLNVSLHFSETSAAHAPSARWSFAKLCTAEAVCMHVCTHASLPRKAEISAWISMIKSTSVLFFFSSSLILITCAIIIWATPTEYYPSCIRLGEVLGRSFNWPPKYSSCLYWHLIQVLSLKMAVRSLLFLVLRIVQIISLLIVMGIYADSKSVPVFLSRSAKSDQNPVVHSLGKTRLETFQIFSELETRLKNDGRDSPATKELLEAATYYVVKFIDYIFRVPSKVYVALAFVSTFSASAEWPSQEQLLINRRQPGCLSQQ